MGATTSATAGSIRTGGPRTATTDTPQATTPTASVPVIVGSMTIAGQTKNVAEARAFLAERPYVRAQEAKRTLTTHRSW